MFETCNSSIANVRAVQETEEVQKRPDGDETVVEFALEGADGGAVRIESCSLTNALLLDDIDVLLLFRHYVKSVRRIELCGWNLDEEINDE